LINVDKYTKKLPNGDLLIHYSDGSCFEWNFVVSYERIKELYEGFIDADLREFIKELNKLRRELQRYRDKQANTLNQILQTIQNGRKEHRRIIDLLVELKERKGVIEDG